MPLPPDLVAEVRRSIRSLVGARLDPARWDEAHAHLRRLGEAVVAGDAEATRAGLVPVAQAGFEGAVRRRLGAPRGSAPAVIPTKRTSGLPLVGAVCAAILLLLGWLLGGGLLLVGTGLLAVGVLGVALAGTRTNLARTQRRHAAQRPTDDLAVDTPPEVLALVAEIERALD
ncbi:MAG TPA: hypothetical protein VK866_18395 [Acidimicrobiales bacterium]|nr:hypothetical protein [Acidimicrobiales bacterium]